MAKKGKNKLPSGNSRIQVYDYTDVDGKKHYKSFTAPTKKEAKFLAAQWLAGKAAMAEEDITLYKAVTRYIDAKRGVLSPSTIRGYEAVQRNYIKPYALGRTKLPDMTNTKLQVWISDISAKVGPKSVRNAHGLVSGTLEMFHPDFHIKTTPGPLHAIGPGYKDPAPACGGKGTGDSHLPGRLWPITPWGDMRIGK